MNLNTAILLTNATQINDNRSVTPNSNNNFNNSAQSSTANSPNENNDINNIDIQFIYDSLNL